MKIHPEQVQDLDDVDTASPTDGEALIFDIATGLWTPGEAGAPIAVDDDDTEVVAEAARLNFGTGLTVTDDGAGAVTVDAAAANTLRGTASISDTDTLVDVAHSLGAAPGDGEIQVAPINADAAAASWWLSDLGASTFRINVETAPGAGNTATFAWLYVPATVAVPPPFSPDDISGLRVWLEAAELTGLADGDPLTTWPDLSPAADDFTGSDPDRPVYVASGGHDGKPAVRFSGSQFLTATAARRLKPVTMFAVTIYPSRPATDNSMMLHRAVGASDGVAWGTRYASPLGAQVQRATSPGVADILDGVFELIDDPHPYVKIFRWDGLTDAAEFRMADVDETSGTSATNPEAQAIRIGARGDGTAEWTGDLRLVLIYTAALTNAQIDDVLAWLDAKFSFLGSPTLPATIPFDTAPGYDGIINWLGTNGFRAGFLNPSTRPVIRSITATQSTDQDATRTADKALDQLIDSDYRSIHTTNVAGSWWKIDLGTRRVEVDHYGLRGREDSGQLLRNWKLQGSNDDSTWTDLDTQTSNASITAGTWFDGSVANATSWRYLRILQTGVNSSGQNYLTLGGFEVWGTISQP